MNKEKTSPKGFGDVASVPMPECGEDATTDELRAMQAEAVLRSWSGIATYFLSRERVIGMLRWEIDRLS